MFDKGYWNIPDVVQGEKYWLAKNGCKFVGLDVGCGQGRLMNKNMVGITLSDWEVAECKRKGFNVKRGDAKKMDFPDNAFPEVNCFFIIEHMLPEDALKVCKECNRVLKPGGKAFFLTEQPSSDFYGDYTHIHPFTRGSLKQLLRDAGFTKIKIELVAPMVKGYNFIGRKFGERWLVTLQMITKPVLSKRCKLLGICEK